MLNVINCEKITHNSLLIATIDFGRNSCLGGFCLNVITNFYNSRGVLGFDDHALIVKFDGHTLIMILKGSCEFNINIK